ncbi:pyridoxal phosphate-dependent decarboxylase family protein [Streptomyces griseorubiginosus]|uniref:pyridoxal phosphate-dependent decarboxylase family protein n=1 Tax=Streptomyces griseorubiginosus TaxID=67304 RepID=UPI0011402C18|nr:aminotransferase class V-fold PLP-dependent enzyme [Streptomyces griseorubiginosus]
MHTSLRPLLDTVLDALEEGTRLRSGPLPAGGPPKVAERLRAAVGEVFPNEGDPEALRHLVRALAEGAADPADPLCTAHLHCPPLAVAAAADLAVSALNPSMDSWDQAPAASELESLVTRQLAREVYAETPGGAGPHRYATPPRGATSPHRPDALITTGGTDSNHLALLLARETHGPGVRLVCAESAHHSLPRAAWLLGMPHPVTLPTLDPTALETALTTLQGPLVVAATAGTTDTGHIDPLPEIAHLCAQHGARLHIDAAYGGGLLFSPRHRAKLTGINSADTVTLDLHKLGWQPVAAGLLAVRDENDLAALNHRADYLNADDDTEAGLPDLLGRSLRTTRRPDVLKIAVTLKTLGREGLAALVDQVCSTAQEFAALIDRHPGFELHAPPTVSTVLFRPVGATDEAVAAARRSLLTDGRAVLGRARAANRLWLKATLLNPTTRPAHLTALLHLVEGTTPR